MDNRTITTEDAERMMKQMKDYIFKNMYDVGDIYITTNSDMDTAEKVAAKYGGKWVAWGSGRVPVGVDTSDTDFKELEKNGGEKTHILDTTEMPQHYHAVGTLKTASAGSHSHKFSYSVWTRATGSYSIRNVYGDSTAGETAISVDSAGAHTHNITGNTDNTGEGKEHNNLQPYITCYMWKRTA